MTYSWGLEHSWPCVCVRAHMHTHVHTHTVPYTEENCSSRLCRKEGRQRGCSFSPHHGLRNPWYAQDRLPDHTAKQCPEEKDLAQSWGAARNPVPGLGQGSDSEGCQGRKNGVSVLLIRGPAPGQDVEEASPA